MRNKKSFEHEEIKGNTDETRDERTKRETVQHNYKHHHNYNIHNMNMIRRTREN